MATSTHPAYPLFDEALAHADRTASRTIIREQDHFRVSMAERGKLSDHLDQGKVMYEDHPVLAPWLERLPDDILSNPSDDYRRRHGLVRVEKRHTHPEAQGRALVGYAAVAINDGVGALILLVANSASADNVTVGNAERNGWAGLVVAGWNWASAARIMRFAADDRMTRADNVFAEIEHAVRSRPGAGYYWGLEWIDPHRDGWRAAVGARKSTDENDARKARTTAGALRRLNNGIWIGALPPVGYRFAQVRDVRGLLIDDPKQPLQVDAGRSVELTTVLREYGDGLPKTTIAMERALRGARDGEGRLLAPLLVPLMSADKRVEAQRELAGLTSRGAVTEVELGYLRDATEQPSTPAARRAATATAVGYVDRIVSSDALRTGVIDHLRVAPTKGRSEYQGWYPTFVVLDESELPDGGDTKFVLEADLDSDHPYWLRSEKRRKRLREYGFWRFKLTCGTPVQLPQDAWDRIAARRKRDRDEFHRRRDPSRQSRPLAGLVSAVHDARQFAFRSGGDESTYSIDVCENAEGQPTGAKRHWTHRHTVGATEAAQQLGRLLVDLAERVECGPVPLLDSPEPVQAENPRETELRALREELSEIEQRLPGYARDLAGVEPSSRRYKAIVSARDADEARAEALESREIPAAERALADSADAADDEATVEEDIDVDFAQIAVAGLALLRCTPRGPGNLTNALAWLLDHGAGFRNLRTGHDRQVLIDVDVRVRAVDGSVEWMHAGTLDLTDRRQTPSRAREFTDDAARRLLADGENAEEVAGRYGWELGQLLHRVSTWLTRHITSQYLRAAVVTAAAAREDVPTGKVVYAVATGDDERLRSLRARYGDWIVAQIQQAYFGTEASWAHGAGWVRKPLAPWRTTMAAVARAGETRRGALIASIAGITNDEQVKDALHPGRTSFWQVPLHLEDGWVSPHRCHRTGCPGGGDAPMTGFLPVPELVIGNCAVFCRLCGCPFGRDEPLPAVYTELWDTDAINSSVQRADGIPYIASEPDAPRLAVSALRTRDVMRRTGLPTYTIQRLAEDGEIPSTRTSGNKLIFNASILEQRSVIEVFDRARAGLRSTTQSHTNNDIIGTDNAARYLATTPTYLRYLVGKRAVRNHGTTARPVYHRSELDGLLHHLRVALGSTTATFADVRGLTEVAEEFDVLVETIHRMIASDLLTAVALGDATAVVVASIDALDSRVRGALDPKTRLTAREVATLVNMAEKNVLYHSLHGDLPNVQLYPRGRRYFLPTEVEQWLEHYRRENPARR